MILSQLKDCKIVLGSGSPRRKELLKHIVPEFEVRVSDADESASDRLGARDTAIFVSRQKALDLLPTLKDDEILITADTEVWMNNRRFGKPNNADEAIEMLESLSDSKHQVVTGVCVVNSDRISSRAITTQVYFNKLTKEEIEYYVNNCNPYDKAGAYGIQDWIGIIGIKKIDGSYLNVVGLPVFELRQMLQSFFNNKEE